MNQQQPPPPQQQQRQTSQSTSAPSPAASEAATKAALPLPAQPTPAAPVTGVAIEPVAGQANDPSLSFDWRVVELGGNRSFGCTVTNASGNPLNVRIEQLSYAKTLREEGPVNIAVLPAAVAGTRGRLVARDETSGAIAEFTWQWQPIGKTKGASSLATKALKQSAPARAGSAKQTAKSATASAKHQAGVANTTFFGQHASGRRFAFILDMSTSMAGARWETCRRELIASLQALPAHVEFFVVLFSSSLAEPPGQSGWTEASADNIGAVINWLSNIHPDGGTYPRPAFARVFSLGGKPDAVYFLTDGELFDFNASYCARLRASGSASIWASLAKFFSFSGRDAEDTGTVINTISLDDRSSSRTLQTMAEESGGQYVHMSSTPDPGT